MEIYGKDIIVTVVEGHRATIVEVLYHPVDNLHLPITATGEALRHPQDKHNRELSVILATGRAVEALGRKLRKRANGLVKHTDDLKAQAHNPKLSANDIREQATNLKPHTAYGTARCQGIKADGEQCTVRAGYLGYCGHHRNK